MVNTGHLTRKKDGDLAFIAVQSTRRRYEAFLFAIPDLSYNLSYTHISALNSLCQNDQES